MKKTIALIFASCMIVLASCSEAPEAPAAAPPPAPIPKIQYFTVTNATEINPGRQFYTYDVSEVDAKDGTHCIIARAPDGGIAMQCDFKRVRQ